MWNHAALDKWYKFVLLSGSHKLVRALEISTLRARRARQIFRLFPTLHVGCGRVTVFPRTFVRIFLGVPVLSFTM